MGVDTRRNSLVVAAIALAASVTSVGNGFAYDDIPIIATNANVHGLSSWWTLFSSSYWPPQYGESLYRPLSMLGYALQWTAGNGHALFFHAVSITLFILLAVAVLLLLREWLDEIPAAAGAGLFAAHPVHTEAVANVVGQAELWAGLGVVVAMVLYLRARRQGGPTVPQALSIGALYGGAALAKEHALLLPLLIAAAEWLMPGERRDRRPVLRLLVLLAVVGGAVVGARTFVLGSLFGEQNPVEMDASTRVWTMFRVIPEWTRLLIWPAHLSAEYGPQQIDIIDAPTPLSLLGIVLVLAFVAGFVASLRRDRAVAFGLAWLAITFLPVSNLVSGVVLQERTLMTPSIGAALLFGCTFEWIARQAPPALARRGLVGFVAVLAALGIARSATRNGVWHDNLTLFTRTVEDAPRSYRAHYLYGMELFVAGRFDEGERELQRAIALSRNDSDPYNFLATKYRDAGLYAPAVPLYRSALEIRPGRPDARYGLALSLLESGDAVAARAQADTGLAQGQLKSYFEWVRNRADSALRAKPVR